MSAHVAGRDFDALVADKVMGWTVLAKRASAGMYDGSWSIDAAIHIGKEGCPQDSDEDLEPVYIRHCSCDIVSREEDFEERVAGWMKLFKESREVAEAKVRRSIARKRAEHAADVERWGHSWHCLSVVPHFSTDIADAWLVVEKLQAGRLMLSVNWSRDMRWWAVVYPESGPSTETDYGDTAPLVICRAALACVGEKLL